MAWRRRFEVFGRCLLAGGCLALAVPPWGWWPLAFVGVALWDRLLADQAWLSRARRSWLVAAAWLFPAMLWMADLTLPGYLIAGTGYAAYFAVASIAVPPTRPARWVALPAMLVLASLAMWLFPFGGVPLASLAISQAGSCAPPCHQFDSPLAQAARLGGPLLVVALVGLCGVALSAASQRRWRALGVAGALVVALTLGGLGAPRGFETATARIALVQGGGPQRTAFGNSDAPEVFARHVQATRDLVSTPVDLIVWPENSVSLEGALDENSYELETLRVLAKEKNAPILAGLTEIVDATSFRNAAVLIQPDGAIGARYDKVRRVPFGEWVPMRALIEPIVGSGGLPARDAIAGTGPPVIDTPAGRMGVSISWEAYFDDRARDSAQHGAEILLNPTNGASYWLTQVQTQQVASNRLRAIETGRWVGEAAPTGLSALIDPAGNLLERSDVSERRVIEATVPRRAGDTIATRVGRWPVALLSCIAIGGAWWLQRRPGPAEDTD